MSQSGYVHLEGCRVAHETDDAFLIEYEGEEHWIPRSQIADPETYVEGDNGVTISVSEWFAKKKGIEGDA